MTQQLPLEFEPPPPHTTCPAPTTTPSVVSRSIENRNQVNREASETRRSSMRQRILDHLQAHGPSTREEVAIALCKEVHQISGRFTALLSAELIEETSDKRPTRTGHLAVVVRLKTKGNHDDSPRT